MIRSILVWSLKTPIGRVLLRTSRNLRSMALVVRNAEWGDLGLTECTGVDGSLQEGSTGSSKECTAAQNNDCAFLPAPFDPETTTYECGAKVKVKGVGTVLNQGKECCDTRVNCVNDD